MISFRFASVAAIVASLCFSSGCANNPQLKNSKKLTAENLDLELQKQADDFQNVWSKSTPSISYIDRTESVFVERQMKLPPDLLEREISNLSIPDDTELRHLNAYLRPLGVNVIFADDSPSAEDGVNSTTSQAGSIPSVSSNLRSINLGIDGFSGTLGELLSILERSYNISFSFVGSNTIKVSRHTTYMASIPQQEAVVKAIESNIKALGGVNVVADRLTGSIIYSASNEDQRNITKFVDRFFENYASIRLQLTVYIVSLNDKASDGYNWSDLDVVLGSVQAAHAGGVVEQFLNNLTNPGNNTGNGSGTGTGTGNGSGTGTGTNPGTGTGSGTNANNPNFGYNTRYSGSSINDMRGFTWLNKDKLKLGLFNNNVSVSVAADWMNQYGSSRAEQSAYLETQSGTKSSISSQRAIPYLGASQTSLVGNQNPVATQSDSIEEKETGMKVEFTTYYDATSQEVTGDISINLKSIVGLIPLELSDGRTSNVPDIQESNIPTSFRMKVGETRLLGGNKFMSLIEDRNSLNLVKMLDSDYIEQNLTSSAMFILIRPTVQLFRTNELGEKPSLQDWVDINSPIQAQ